MIGNHPSCDPLALASLPKEVAKEIKGLGAMGIRRTRNVAYKLLEIVCTRSQEVVEVDSRKHENCANYEDDAQLCKLNNYMDGVVPTKCQGWKPAPVPRPEEATRALNEAVEALREANKMDECFDLDGIVRRHIADLTRRVAELENPVTFFCAYCREEFPATADGLKEGMQHELTCPEHPLVRRLAEAEAKCARLGVCKEKLGKRLHETRAKLRKVEQENRENQGRVEALEACLGLCRQCQYPGACASCPNDSALAATEAK